MDIKEFLKQLEKLIEKVETTVERIENNIRSGIKEMPVLIEEIQKILPEWFFFIEKTEIGDSQNILDVLTDVIQGVEAEDSILLSDALFFGLRQLMIEYKHIIEEALDGE